MLEVKVPVPVVSSVKKALSVDKDFDPFTVTIDELITKNPFIADRPECETDTTALQIIPYITLVDNSGPELKYFVYTRGKASGEQRLAGKCSVGLGGHIEEIENVDIFHNALVDSICLAAVREIKEEIGLDIAVHVFANAMIKNYTGTKESTENQLYMPSARLLYNSLTPTDVVHLGVSFVLKAKESDIKETELDVITRGRWMTYTEIEDAEQKDSPIVLELWSKTVLARVNLYSKANSL